MAMVSGLYEAIRSLRIVAFYENSRDSNAVSFDAYTPVKFEKGPLCETCWLKFGLIYPIRSCGHKEAL